MVERMGGLIGSYKIPYATVSEAIGVATTVVSKYNGTLSRASLAQELRMSDNGGAYVNKLATYKLYGLLRGRDMLEATDLAQKIALSKDATIVAQSKASAFLAYPLFSELFGRIKARIPDDDVFTNILAEVTGVNRIEASKKLPEIRKYYVDALQYLKDYGGVEPLGQQAQIPSEHPTPSGGRSVSQLMMHEPSKTPEGLEEIVMGDVRIWLRPDMEDVNIAKGLLGVYEKKLKQPTTKKPRI